MLVISSFPLFRFSELVQRFRMLGKLKACPSSECRDADPCWISKYFLSLVSLTAFSVSFFKCYVESELYNEEAYN